MLARRAKRNGMLRDSPFHDYIVGVLDGIETFSSYKKQFGKCPGAEKINHADVSGKEV